MVPPPGAARQEKRMKRTGNALHGRNKGITQAAPLLAGLMFSTGAMAADNWKTEGAHGQIYVSGALLAGACGLRMDSEAQDIWLGETSTASLRRAGDEGTSVPVELHLTGCLPVAAASLDRRTGNMVWSHAEPAVSVSFYAPVAPDMPAFILADGVSGLAVRLRDATGKTVRLNERNAPSLVYPGDNILRYTLTPVRTPAPLLPGAWRAVVNFGVSYD